MAGPKFWGWAEPEPAPAPQQEYVIVWTERPPLATPGASTGPSSRATRVRDVQREIRKDHGRVLSTRRKSRWFW
jgi:hypothetical protein